ncbi:MAG TPA: hypothetical protein VL306_00880 [Methylomirabilota bacterium]|jgi:hypothetical protein|nr:hypothetical protein [Methylomirabilota bacterium]
MNPETLSPEEVRKMEISRAKSDEAIEDVAYYTDLHNEGEAVLSGIKELESKEFKVDFDNLKKEAVKAELDYNRVWNTLSSQRISLQEFAQHARNGYQPDTAKIIEQIKSESMTAESWRTAVSFVGAAKRMSEQYGLQVPLLEKDSYDILSLASIDDIMVSLEQARYTALYLSKEHLGKIK